MAVTLVELKTQFAAQAIVVSMDSVIDRLSTGCTNY